MGFDFHALGRVIRRLRKKRKLTQEVLSGFADIPRSHLSSIETGTKKINMDTAYKLAQALDMPLSELIHLAEEEMKNNKRDEKA